MQVQTATPKDVEILFLFLWYVFEKDIILVIGVISMTTKILLADNDQPITKTFSPADYNDIHAVWNKGYEVKVLPK